MEASELRDALKAGVILAVITVAEGCWLVVNVNHRLDRFLHYTGFRGKGASLWGWIAAVVCPLYFLSTPHVFRPSDQTSFVSPG